MRRSFVVALCLIWTCIGVQAQTAPFDMAPERDDTAPSILPRQDVAPAAPATPAPAPVPQQSQSRPAESQQPKPVQPLATPARPTAQPKHPTSASREAAPQANPSKASTSESRNEEPAQSETAEASGLMKRYLVPSGELDLPGETASESWSVELTGAEAAAKELHLAYQNSIVVAPEASRLRVLLNGTPVVDRAVDSAGGVQALSVPVAEGVLRPGTNTVRVDTNLRHRTDCSVDSTYQLWTRIDPSKTYLAFEPANGGRYTNLDDIKAVGVDGQGRTRFDIVVPALDQPAVGVPLLRLAEGLSLHAGMPNQSFQVMRSMPKSSGPGRLTVLVGTASEIAGIVSKVPAAASTSPVASFVPSRSGDDSVLVISGPSWTAINAAVDDIVTPLDRPAGPRPALLTQAWHAPNAPVLYGGDTVSFSSLGIDTTGNFSGRRYSTKFYFGIPSDFYASAYGRATILLDAAYSSTIEPGSRINVYVNGHIASTYPISADGGAILRHLPIKVTMRDFRPGLNVISLEAILSTKGDERCLPGSTADTTPRFALFDTSEFVVPKFARIGQRPNLAALSGTGFPYNLTNAPLSLVMGDTSPEIMSSTATMLARIALAAGRPIAVNPVSDVAPLADRSGLFVGRIDQMDSAVLDQLGVSDTVRSSWGDAEGSVGNEQADTRRAFQDWRNRLRGGRWVGQVSSFEDWLNRNFDISLSSLRFAPKADRNFIPARGATLMVAQASNPGDSGTWTMVTAPTGAQLESGVAAVTRQTNWAAIAGHIATYDAKRQKLAVEPVSTFALVATQPPSLANFRLIAANWLSSNTLTYAALFAIVSVILGMATAGLLSKLGRRR